MNQKELLFKQRVIDLIKESGFTFVSNLFGSLDEVHEIIGLKGTQEDMIFIVNAIINHDIDERICDIVIRKTRHSIDVLVKIPVFDPNSDVDSWVNVSNEIRVEEKISGLIYKLGNGLVRGHRINVITSERC